MGAYELDDEMVRACLHNGGAALPKYLAETLAAQLPKPIPTRLGAVVRTDEGLFVYADEVDARCWFMSGSGSGDWRTPGELHTIVEVLSEGVVS